MGKNLYKKNNNNQVLWWTAYPSSNATSLTINVEYGILGGMPRKECYPCTMKGKTVTEILEKEIKSRYNEKRKSGYISFDEFRDDTIAPQEDITNPAFIQYAKTYLKTNLSNSNTDALLPMLAKTYSGKVWEKEAMMYGQWKINGLRCFISAYATTDLFNPYKLKFQSREGTIWTSLNYLEQELIAILGEDKLIRMIDDNIILDGELYLPGYSVNDINHFVKDPTCVQNNLIQFWCYDIAIENTSQSYRNIIRQSLIPLEYRIRINDKGGHLNYSDCLMYVPEEYITNDYEAVKARNNYIDMGFEGLILRNPNAEYQFGRRRVGIMEKFKAANEGDFQIIDIYKEEKRDLPILLCRNDINDNTFETRLSDTHESQQLVLKNKDKYIGKYVHLHFGERSGVESVPFHIKDVTIKL